LCTDGAPEAVQLAQLSGTKNNLQNFSTAVIDWNNLPRVLEADVVLLSDVNYDPVAFTALIKMINSFILKDVTVILSTPQRLVAKEFVLPLLQHAIQQEEITVRQQGKDTVTTVMVLRQ
jgi:predicted nicotinamide N-methyase